MYSRAEIIQQMKILIDFASEMHKLAVESAQMMQYQLDEVKYWMDKLAEDKDG